MHGAEHRLDDLGVVGPERDVHLVEPGAAAPVHRSAAIRTAP